MSPRPDLGVWPQLGYAGKPHRPRRREAHRRRRAARARSRRRGRAGMWSAASSWRCARPRRDSIRCSSAREAQALGAVVGKRLPRPHGRRAALCRWRSSRRRSKRSRRHDDFEVTDLRTIAVRGMVEAEHLPPLAEGKSLLVWHARRRFCSNCGARALAGRGRLAARLPDLQDAALSRAPIRS